MGGLADSTRLYTLDTDALMNIVTAGDTYDATLHQMTSGGQYYPLVVMIDGAYKNKRWIKVYDQPNFYVKRVVFNPDATRVAIAMRYFLGPGEIMETHLYTMNARDGSSRSHFTLPYNSFDMGAYDMKEQLLYDANNDVIMAFRTSDLFNLGSGHNQMQYRLVKFSDTLPPTISWGLQGVTEGYVFAIGFGEN